MAIQGLRNTGVLGGTGANNSFVAGQRPLNWRDAVLLLEPNGMAPLYALSSQMKSAPVDDPEFNWWEKRLETKRVTLAAAITSGSQTSLTLVAGGLGLPIGTLLRMEGGVSGAPGVTGGGALPEIVRVTAVTSDTAITVSRNFSGGTAVTALAIATAGSNPNLVAVGTAFEEGSSAPAGVNYDPVKRTNYTQIFRNTLEMTRTAQKTRLRTGDAIREAKRECLLYHSIDIEKASFFGVKTEGVLGALPIRSSGGLEYFLQTYASGNIVTADTSTGVKWNNIEDYMKQMFTFGSQEKVAFLGNTALLTIQRALRYGKGLHINLMPQEKEYGMTVQRLTSSFGTLVLKTHPLFNQFTGATVGGTPYYAVDSWMFVVDMAYVRYRPFDDTRYEAKYETPGMDGMKSGYLTDAGFEWNMPEAHFLVKNLAVPAAE
jgi:hypothetical protein